MARLSRSRAETIALTLAAFVLALLQRPGVASSDTKIDLHVDPVGFLAGVTSTWSATGTLGHVQGGQYSGYAWPMGPWFALGRLIDLPPWLVHRLWLGALLAVAACGVAALARVLGGPRRPLLPVAAAAVAVLNPYVVVLAGRTSITLLAYAVLPWLLLAVHRGLRAPRSWWWPAAFALLLASAGGGVNFAVIAFVAVAPVALALYEVMAGHVETRALRSFAARTAALVAVTSAWWIAPLAVQALYGTDFLRFTEQPGTIWTTTSAPEALRLMGYWTSYIGVGYTGVLRPFQADAGVYLFHPAVLLATLALPALAVGGLVWTRRWRYGPFAWGLLLLGVLLVMIGFPDGTPLRRAATFAYNHAAAVQFLRTSFKAAPLVALALALLTGAAADELWRRFRGLPARAAVAGGLAALLALCAWPLVRGQALDSQLTWRAIPAAWRDAAAGIDRELAPNTRALLLPGEMFAAYRWGETYDPVLPVLTDRPVAARAIVPYGDLHAADLLLTTDGLIQQGRLLPGQLPPLLRLLGAGAVVTGSDSDRARSGAIGAAEAARRIASALGPPDRAYGPQRRVPAQAGTLDPPATLPQVARRDVDGGAGIVRLRPAAAPLLLDGSAAGLAGLAALGGLDPGRAVLYAGDRSAAELRAAAAAGADLVVTDSNRRRTLATSKARHGEGPTLAADDPISADAAVLDPFAARGTAAQTIAVRDGVASLRAPASPGSTQFPEHRAFAAVDGDERSAWLADPRLDGARHWIELGFGAPRDVEAIDLLPHRDARGATVAVEIAGRRIALRPRWNHVRLGLRRISSLRIRIAEVLQPAAAPGAAGGIDELRVPGVRVSESLRPPRLLEDALRGADVSRSALSYVFERTTAADPLRRSPAAGTPQAYRARDAEDAEAQLDRRFAPPAARRYAADGWATVAPDAPDAALDGLAGTAGAGRFLSSGRFEGRADRRGSRAFDGDPSTAWVGVWIPGRPAWLSWASPRRATVRRLVLRAPAATVRRPTRVRLDWDGGRTPALPVAADGTVALPARVRGRSFRLEILAAAFPAGTPGRVRQRRAVAIAEVEGAGVRAPARPAARRLTAACGALSAVVGGRLIRLRPVGTTAALEAGSPLRVRGCGPPLELGAGPARLLTRSTLLRPLLLRLRSPATATATAAAAAPAPAGRVLDPGRLGRSTVDGVRVAVDRPAWLVLAEGYDRGWRAWCDGRSLGPPRVVDGFANGWRVGPGCGAVRFAFAPDRAARAIALVSGAACLAALALLLLRRRPWPAPDLDLDLDLATVDAPPRMPWRRAVAAAVPAGLALGFVFGARYAPVFAVIVALVLRKGVGPRALIAAAALLLGLVVPALYLVLIPADHGGYAFEYAGELIAAHWIAVLALVALLLAYARTLTGAVSIGAWVRGSRGGAWASGTRRLRRRSGRSRT